MRLGVGSMLIALAFRMYLQHWVANADTSHCVESYRIANEALSHRADSPSEGAGSILPFRRGYKYRAINTVLSRGA